MITKHYVNAAGEYMGGFGGAKKRAKVPKGAIEVSTPPANAADTWDGAAWVENAAERGRATNRQKAGSETAYLLDAVLDHLAGAPLPSDFAGRVAARKTAKAGV